MSDLATRSHMSRTARVRLLAMGTEAADPRPSQTASKYRNKIGMEAALEALKDAWRRRRVGIGELERFARICRVECDAPPLSAHEPPRPTA